MATATQFYVYVHERLDNGFPFYVGKGSCNRATSKKDRNNYWHNIVNKVGYRVKIIQNNLTKSQALNAEKFTIALFKKFFKLTNMTDGGDGGNGLKGALHPLYGIPRSQECKNKISKSLQGVSTGGKAKKGIKLSESHKKAISNGLKGKPKSAEHIAKVSAAQKGRIFSEAHKQAIRDSKRKGVKNGGL